MLIIAGEAEFRSMIHNICRNIGITNVENAETGDSALEMLAAKKYTILLVHSEIDPSGAKFIEFMRKSGDSAIPTVLIM